MWFFVSRLQTWKGVKQENHRSTCFTVWFFSTFEAVKGKNKRSFKWFLSLSEPTSCKHTRRSDLLLQLVWHVDTDSINVLICCFAAALGVPVWVQQAGGQRNHGRHRVWTVVTKHPLIITPPPAARQQPLPRRPAAVPMVIRDKDVGNTSPVPLATKRKLERQEGEGLRWNVAAAGWMKVFEGGGAGRSSDGCYWSFFSESDESSLVPASSGEVSSYLRKRRRNRRKNEQTRQEEKKHCHRCFHVTIDQQKSVHFNMDNFISDKNQLLIDWIFVY